MATEEDDQLRKDFVCSVRSLVTDLRAKGMSKRKILAICEPPKPAEAAVDDMPELRRQMRALVRRRG